MAIVNKGDRKYLVIIHLGYDGAKRKTKSRRVNLQHLTQRQAEKEIILIERAFEDEVKGNPNNDASMTLKGFIDIWMDDYVSQHLRPKTISSYKHELEKRILPGLGYMKITEIRPTHLIRFYSKLSKATYKKGKEEMLLSSRTIKYQHQILSSIFGQAVKWQIVKENPCKLVVPPKSKTTAKIDKKKYWEEYEVEMFLKFIQDEKLKYICAVELALFGGLRTEEILGLGIDDIMEDGVAIKRTSKLVDGVMIVEDLAKNESSERTITLPGPVIRNLKKLRLEQKTLYFKLREMWQDERLDKNHRILLFTQDNGKPMYGKTPNQWFKRKVKEYNESHKDRLTEITFHGLRHTSAALMIYLGADIKVGAARLGHAQTSTFLNMYGGMLERADREISNKLEDMLLNKNVE